jgi:hypothetical protein
MFHTFLVLAYTNLRLIRLAGLPSAGQRVQLNISLQTAVL